MHGGLRSRPHQGSVHLFNVVVIAAFIGIIAFCAYDGFKEIFTKPQPFKPKQTEESLAELKAAIASSKDFASNHKYVKAGRGERRSALATEANIATQPSYVFEPVVEAFEEDPPPYTKVVVLSAVQESPCITEGGDELHYLSVKNKQDYARINGYDFVLGMKQADPSLENMWNKPAWINKVLGDESLSAEWVIWVDIDTVVLDANFTLPFEEFAAKSKDLIVYGNVTQVRKGHPIQALNTGVMVIRNTPWARKFFSEVARLGRLDDHHFGKNTLSKILLKELQADAYSDGLRDQNAVIYLLKTHPEWQDRVAFLDKEICLNCFWRDLIGVTGYGKPDFERQENVSFVQHFMGCQICNALNRNGDLEACQQGMFHSFKYTKQYHAPMLSNAPVRSEKHMTQLKDLPYCSLNPLMEGCDGAKPLDDQQKESLRSARESMKYDWKTIDNAIVESTLNNIKADQTSNDGNLSDQQSANSESAEISLDKAIDKDLHGRVGNNRLAQKRSAFPENLDNAGDEISDTLDAELKNDLSSHLDGTAAQKRASKLDDLGSNLHSKSESDSLKFGTEDELEQKHENLGGNRQNVERRVTRSNEGKRAKSKRVRNRARLSDVN